MSRTVEVVYGGKTIELETSSTIRLPVRVRRDRRQVYLEFWDDDVAESYVHLPGDALYWLRDLVDRRRGEDGKTIAVLEVDKATGQLEDLRIRDGYERKPWSGDLGRDQLRYLLKQAVGGPQ